MIERVRPAIVRVRTNMGSGSGVIYSKSKDGVGLVITNYHVIEGASFVNVEVEDSTVYTSTIRGIDALRDLAVLEICCSDFTTVGLAAGDEVATGTEIVVIGYALGIAGQATVTRGIVSAFRYESETSRWVVQTDASINPGNSGGPMISPSGEIIGIATYKFVSSRGGIAVEGVGFAVSQRTLREQLPVLTSGKALAFPTPTPRAPTPTPAPTTFRLRINGIEVNDALFIMAQGSVKVVPPPDDDGTYQANSVVNLWVFNNNPRGGAQVGGVDSVDPRGIATVVMTRDRDVELVFF